MTLLPSLKYKTHHGHARTIMPIAGDLELWEKVDGPRWGGVTHRLNQEYGAWGLAYYESLVRLSDWIHSEEEQQDGI